MKQQMELHAAVKGKPTLKSRMRRRRAAVDMVLAGICSDEDAGR